MHQQVNRGIYTPCTNRTSGILDDYWVVCPQHKQYDITAEHSRVVLGLTAKCSLLLRRCSLVFPISDGNRNHGVCSLPECSTSVVGRVERLPETTRHSTGPFRQYAHRQPVNMYTRRTQHPLQNIYMYIHESTHSNCYTILNVVNSLEVHGNIPYNV